MADKSKPSKKVTPKLRHKLLLQKALKNGGRLAPAMRELGYSEATINSPKNITQTDSWQELLKRHIPESKLAQKLDEGLEANKQLAKSPVFKKDAPTSQSAHELPTALDGNFIEVPDFAVRHKYLETALKVSGKIIEKKDITTDGEKLEALQVVIVEEMHE